MPKLRVAPRVPAKQSDDELKLGALTRDDVAKRLDISISTVRRLEGTRLHPAIDSKSGSSSVRPLSAIFSQVSSQSFGKPELPPRGFTADLTERIGSQ